MFTFVLNVHSTLRLKTQSIPTSPGANPGFQVRGGGGGGAHLNKLHRAEGGAKIWGISCEKSRFYAKKIIFFPILGPPPPPPVSAPVVYWLHYDILWCKTG